MEIKILIISLIFFVILYTVCKMVMNGAFVQNLVFGYFVTGANFLNMSRKLRKLLSFNAVPSAFSYLFRFLILAILFYLWFKYRELNVWGLLVGISLIPLSIPIGVIIFNEEESNGAST